MTPIERWFLKRVFAKEVCSRNTIGLYEMIREAWCSQFTEDNVPTISAALEECFEATQVWPYGRPTKTEKP
jgi:hypothetical protein